MLLFLRHVPERLGLGLRGGVAQDAPVNGSGQVWRGATVSSGLKDDLVAYAAAIGLDLIGVTTAEPFPRLQEELDARAEHYQDRYAYRIETWRKLATPREALPGAKSVVVIGFAYLANDPAAAPGEGKMGRIVTYGHLGILKRARLVRRFLEARGHRAVIGAHRKEAALRAGLGSIGKNNLVLNPRFGTWVAYQSIVTDAELCPDEPSPEDVCGDCNACLTACPTGALYAPRRVDPRRCVACMLTSRQVAEADRPALASYILGCDACQEACPRNAKLKPKEHVESLLPDGMGIHPPLRDLLRMNEAGFQRELIGFIQSKIMEDTLLNRLLRVGVLRKLFKVLAKTFSKGGEVLPETFVHASGNLAIYQRNALVAAGNLREAALRDDVACHADDPYLGEYAKWALGRIDG
jgi:epoxyqueuosine reductase